LNDPAIGVPWSLATAAIVTERDQVLPLVANYRMAELGSFDAQQS
jgi:hypothetical protein